MMRETVRLGFTTDPVAVRLLDLEPRSRLLHTLKYPRHGVSPMRPVEMQKNIDPVPFRDRTRHLLVM